MKLINTINSFKFKDFNKKKTKLIEIKYLNKICTLANN